MSEKEAVKAVKRDCLHGGGVAVARKEERPELMPGCRDRAAQLRRRYLWKV